MDNLSDIKFREDHDEKEDKSQNKCLQFSIDLGSLNEFGKENALCSEFASNDVSIIKPYAAGEFDF